MTDLQKAGGLAALLQALIYVLGFAAMATVLNPGAAQDWSAQQKLAFILERKAMFMGVNFVIYVLFGVLLTVLAVALHERWRERSPQWMKLATPFGLIWAGLVIASGMIANIGLQAVATLQTKDPSQAVIVWRTIQVVADGIGGGNEIVGALWVLLLSAAAWRSKALPAGLLYLGVFVGVCGLLSAIPPLKDSVILFGLSQIVWFAWIGLHVLRQPSPQ
ncbi:hypothetical protein V8J88_02320 [Massilia sp. W12]|uniref:hypothetical protein n=1 Tax=Massilia sp. W12 TaxID=3126507 RepID=UPI0030CB82D3